MALIQKLHARCACALAAPAFTLSGTKRHYERSRPFEIRHLALDLGLNFDEESVSGGASLDFVRVAPDAEELELDAVGFEISRVRIDSGKEARDAHYSYDGDRISITIPKRSLSGRVEIRYTAKPRRGLYFMKPDAAVRSRPKQVWSQCQDEDARHWFPCHDKPHVKMTTELKVRVPHGFNALSNGELVKSDTPKARGKSWSYHFKLDRPHPSYLMTLVAGRFDGIDDRPAQLGEGREVPIRYLVPPGQRAAGKRSFGETPRMIELFSRLTGVDYPWSRYTQVVVADFIFGGMENTTATTMYEHILLDEKAARDVSSHDLVAHELAHQWFGDYVTCRDWSHGWLNEGFATFFEHVEREDRLGRDEYDYGVEGEFDSYLSEARGRYQRPIVCRDYQHPIDLFDRHLYEKGSLVLHMLRRDLGNELFWKGVHHYLTANAHGIVETVNLQRALEDVSGRSLEQFFDSWVYRPGHPALKVKVAWEKGLLSVSVRQTQQTGDTAVFAFDLEIEVADAKGKLTRHKKHVRQSRDSLVVALAERPAWVAFDPEFRVAADVSLEVPNDMLRRQLEKGSSARTRWKAAQALADRDDLPTCEALRKSLHKASEAWMVRVEAARALGRIKTKDAFAALKAQIKTPHPKVRRAVVSALGNFRSSEAAKLLLPLSEKDDSYLVESEAGRALGRTRDGIAKAALTRMLARTSWADVVRAGALDGLAALRDADLVPLVVRQTEYGIPTRGRRSAISALARLSDEREVRRHLEDLLDDADPHLRIEVVHALQTVGDRRCRPALNRRLAHELDGRVARVIREALRDMGDATSSERRRVNDELEGLRNELGELKERLNKVESGKRRAGSQPAPSTKKTKAKSRGESGSKKTSARRRARPSEAAADRGRRPRERKQH